VSKVGLRLMVPGGLDDQSVRISPNSRTETQVIDVRIYITLKGAAQRVTQQEGAFNLSIGQKL
jgi:hypothetical protein